MKRWLFSISFLAVMGFACGHSTGTTGAHDSTAVQAMTLMESIDGVDTTAIMQVDTPPLPRPVKTTKDSLDKLRIKEYNTHEDNKLDSLKQLKKDAYRKQGVKAK